MSEAQIFAVAGNPVLHSRSPLIFNFLFKEMGIDATYTRILVQNAGEAVQTANSVGMEGLNITSPFKNEIIPFLDGTQEPVLTVDAVNCVVRENGRLVGYNTDTIGAVQALQKNGFRLKDKKIVILGAGGAARAAAGGFIKAEAESVTLVNRNRERARKAAERLGCDSEGLDNLKDILARIDILVSCVPSVSDLLEPSALRKDLVVMDANYKDSLLIPMASEKGCRVINGMDWLLYQALPSFELFTHKKTPLPLVKRIRELLRSGPGTEKSNIAIIGFMGSGKTHVGKTLAAKTARPFIDTDTLIEETVGSSIPDIFREKGEDFFRQAEKSVIKSVLSSTGNSVISLGGGSVLDPENQSLIREHCLSIWLWVTPETALKRINLFSRPLLNVPQTEKKATSMLEQRKSLYAKTADLVVNTETGDRDDLAQRILNEMD